MDKRELKEVTKAAIKEWMDDKYREFGRWTVHAIVASGFAAMIYFILKMNGWQHP